MAKAAEILGVEHTWLGFVDSGLPKGDPPPPLPEGCFALVPLEVSVEALVRVVREFRPHVMTTYDENGGYPHPGPHSLPPGFGRRLRGGRRLRPLPGRRRAVDGVQAVLQPRLPARADAVAARRIRQATARRARSRQWLKHWDPEHDPFESRVTTRVECSAYFSQRDDALRAHATQIDPNAEFFAAPISWQQRLWPTEEFELARSRVPVRLPEDDLFAGIESDG